VTNFAAACLLLFAFCGCGKNEPPKLDNNEAAIACATNLRQIDAAKKSWAQKQGAGIDAAPTADDLVPFFRRGVPTCLQGGPYTIGKVGEMPQCSIAAHNEYFKANPPPEP
jgi:hypothetical protein